VSNSTNSHAPAGLGSQTLIAGSREDLYGRAALHEPDHARLAGMGDVCAAAVLSRAAEEHATVAVRDDHGPDRVLPALARDELVPVFASGSRAPDSDLGSVDDPGLSAGTEMVDDLGQCPQPHTPADGAPSFGEKWPHLADGTGNGGAVDPEPAGQHVVRGGVSQMHERGREPVDEHQPVLRARAHRQPPRPGRELGLVPLMPQRSHLSYKFSDHIRRQARDPSIADDHCTRRVPHHTTMIDDGELDTSPPTMHELVRTRL
jgi:hypothetical protein